MPKVEQLVADMLKYCLEPSDQDRAFVEFKPDDVVLLLINNFGGKTDVQGVGETKCLDICADVQL